MYSIIIMSSKQSLGDILCLLRFLLFLLLFFFFLSSAKSLSDTFLCDYWTEINETSQECKALWVDIQTTFGIFKVAAVAMETAKMLKNWKTQKLS
jgi:type III secretory pathway component EscU